MLPWAGDEVYLQVSLQCAEAVAESVTLDWASFSSQPHGFQGAASESELVISGLLMILASPLGDAESIVERYKVSEPVGTALEAIVRDGDVRASDPAGDLLWAFFRSEVSSVGFEQWLGAQGQFDHETQAVTVSGLFASDGARRYEVPTMAALLLHEAMHSVAPAHVDCFDYPIPACDLDATGAHPSAMLFVQHWREENLGRYPCDGEFTNHLDAARSMACQLTLNHDGLTFCSEHWGPCDK